MSDVQLLERGAFVDVQDPVRGQVRVLTAPVRLHGSEPRGIDRTAPALGQDTERVLGELLRMSQEELAGLEALGVTGSHAPIDRVPPA
jgi:crotonobetainyl-CoA:carnitine CoA-transferase CaiB-like acyl-CoA transferase